jgi:hypothetical protein
LAAIDARLQGLVRGEALFALSLSTIPPDTGEDSTAGPKDLALAKFEVFHPWPDAFR